MTLYVILAVLAVAYVVSVIWRDTGDPIDYIDDDELDIEPFEWDDVCQRELDRHKYLLAYYRRCKAQEKNLYSKDEKFMMWSEWHVEAMRLGPAYVGRTPEEVVDVINRRIGELMFLKS